MKKTKMKDKGKRSYRNTHGNWYRVRRSYKIRHKNKRSETMRALNKQAA